MKKIIFITIAILSIISCGNHTGKTYRPSEFPKIQENVSYSFAIPYADRNNSIVVRVRLNGGPQFDGIWDSGCGVPLKITSLEASQLVKNGTLSDNDYQQALPITVANGDTNEYAVYKLKMISFTDCNGDEHIVRNVPAVIDVIAAESMYHPYHFEMYQS